MVPSPARSSGYCEQPESGSSGSNPIASSKAAGSRSPSRRMVSACERPLVSVAVTTMVFASERYTVVEKVPFCTGIIETAPLWFNVTFAIAGSLTRPATVISSLETVSSSGDVIVRRFRAGCTAKLTSKDSLIPFPPATVTVAVYVPSSRPWFGVTAKVALPPTPMLLIVGAETVKLALESVTFSNPVG